MKYILPLSIVLMLLTGCKTTEQLKPISEIEANVSKEGTLANQTLIHDTTTGLQNLTGIPIKDADILKFVIQQPVGEIGARAWREMWIVKIANENTQFLITFKEVGLGAADFEIEQMVGTANTSNCPDPISDFKKGQSNELVKQCLGKPDNIDSNPDGRYIYFYYRPKGVILTYLFDEKDQLIRVNAYQDKN